MIEYYINKLKHIENEEERLKLLLFIELYEDPIIERRALFDEENGYKYIIRTNEDIRHVPHFHISYQEREGSFDLLSCELLQKHNSSLNERDIKQVNKWYKKNRDGIIKFWDKYQPNRKVLKETI